MTPRRTPRRSSLLVCLLSALTLGNTGCVALLDAALKESDDHGRGASYENKSYGEHYLDSLLEDDDDCDSSRAHHSSPALPPERAMGTGGTGLVVQARDLLRSPAPRERITHPRSCGHRSSVIVIHEDC